MKLLSCFALAFILVAGSPVYGRDEHVVTVEHSPPPDRATRD